MVDANRELDMVKAKYAEFEDIIFDKLQKKQAEAEAAAAAEKQQEL